MKIKLIIFFLFCLCLNSIQAQIVNYTPKIDSIQQLLTKRPTADSLRVLQLNDLAQVCFKDLQYKRGLMATKEARILAKKLNFEKGEGLYFNTMNNFQGNSYLAFYYIYNEIWFYSDRHAAVPKENLNLAPLQNIDVEKSTQALMTALAYFEQNPDAEITANILYLISSNYRGLNKLDEGMPYLDKAFRKFQEAKQPMKAYYLLTYKGLFLERSGKKEEAKLVQQEVNKFITANSDNRETALIYIGVSNFYREKKDLPLAFEANSKANLLLERLGERQLRAFILEILGDTYIYYLALPNKAIDFYLQSKTLEESINDKTRLAYIYNKVAFTFIKLKRFDEAKEYVDKAKKVIETFPDSPLRKRNLAQHYDALGQIQMGKQLYQEALLNFNQAIEFNKSVGAISLNFYFNMYIAQCYQKLGNLEESIKFGLLSYKPASEDNGANGVFVTPRVAQLLFENYDSLGQPLEAYKYLKIQHKFQKQVEEQNAANRLAEMEIQSIVLKGEQEKNRLEQARLLKEKENQNQRWWLFSIAAALFSAVVMAVILYRNNHHKQKANALLHLQKEEIDHQRDKAEKAFTQLKATQNQLIQSEKLASLGELTAGIAHEIQNPLNFVNNFSELSVDLAKELKEEIEKSPLTPDGGIILNDKEYVGEILSDLSQNQEKINHHGKRASSIVKGMLEHSRTSTGVKELTDMNVLVDEYLRLAYHGMRAKDSSFNADFKTDFDENLPKVEVIPQDFGRVLLNLINNAFYAVSNHNHVETGHAVPTVALSLQSQYQPTVIISTQQSDNKIIIKIKDNGIGMSEATKAKIFQPFFTTKPTGQGTGLGLSLAYDIITKGHSGSLEVESEEGKGTVFIVKLPIT